jgi:hypothetical protein
VTGGVTTGGVVTGGVVTGGGSGWPGGVPPCPGGVPPLAGVLPELPGLVAPVFEAPFELLLEALPFEALFPLLLFEALLPFEAPLPLDAPLPLEELFPPDALLPALPLLALPLLPLLVLLPVCSGPKTDTPFDVFTVSALTTDDPASGRTAAMAANSRALRLQALISTPRVVVSVPQYPAAHKPARMPLRVLTQYRVRPGTPSVEVRKVS